MRQTFLKNGNSSESRRIFFLWFLHIANAAKTHRRFKNMRNKQTSFRLLIGDLGQKSGVSKIDLRQVIWRAAAIGSCGAWSVCRPHLPHANESRKWRADVYLLLTLAQRESRANSRNCVQTHWTSRPATTLIVSGRIISVMRRHICSVSAIGHSGQSSLSSSLS